MLSLLIMFIKKVNFGAGPAKIPESVLETAQEEFLNFNNTGISILEMSHRSKDFGAVLEETKTLLREVMQVPDDFEILFMQGGGTGQFAAIPLNLKGNHDHADYVITGTWSSKAALEAEKFIKVKKVFPPAKPYTTVPDEHLWECDASAAYIYYCANETVHGIEFPKAPHTPHGVPLVADVSSNFLARPFDFTNHGVVFGGTQKNLGAAGLTIAMVRKDLLNGAQPQCPAILDYKEMVGNNSLYNTPPVYSIYITNLVLKWIKNQGGLEVVYQRNLRKSALIYSIIDGSDGFYSCAIDPRYRSIMNVCFRIGGAAGDEKLEAEFLEGAQQRGMISLKGHRSVGGIRASIYNAVTEEETEHLATWMKEFLVLKKN